MTIPAELLYRDKPNKSNILEKICESQLIHSGEESPSLESFFSRLNKCVLANVAHALSEQNCPSRV